MVYGKEYNVPRMVAAYGDAGVKYTYSRRTLGTLPWVSTDEINESNQS